ncbi:MAG: FliA/WhiG family RNA polymerase sigma factor [Thermodesulfovibrionales bacterium]|nr:FliA/WhiG family RNA polymerase sigma factor [Thermodesulfovibrionales bacterium]
MATKAKERIKKNRKLSEKEREELIKDMLPYIKYNALRLSWRLPPQLTVEDLISIGIIGLLEAADRFDESEGRIHTYVKYRIKGAMLDELERHSTVSKSMIKRIQHLNNVCKEMEKKTGELPQDEEIAEALNISINDYYEIIENAQPILIFNFEDLIPRQPNGEDISLSEIIPDKNSKNPLQLFEQKNMERYLATLIDELPEKEKLILSLYYWDELTMKEISKVLDISEGRVCQLHNKSLIWLRSRLEEDGKIKDFFTNSDI